MLSMSVFVNRMNEYELYEINGCLFVDCVLYAMCCSSLSF